MEQNTTQEQPEAMAACDPEANCAAVTPVVTKHAPWPDRSYAPFAPRPSPSQLALSEEQEKLWQKKYHARQEAAKEIADIAIKFRLSPNDLRHAADEAMGRLICCRNDDAIAIDKLVEAAEAETAKILAEKQPAIHGRL